MQTFGPHVSVELMIVLGLAAMLQSSLVVGSSGSRTSSSTSIIEYRVKATATRPFASQCVRLRAAERKVAHRLNPARRYDYHQSSQIQVTLQPPSTHSLSSQNRENFL